MTAKFGIRRGGDDSRLRCAGPRPCTTSLRRADALPHRRRGPHVEAPCHRSGQRYGGLVGACTTLCRIRRSLSHAVPSAPSLCCSGAPRCGQGCAAHMACAHRRCRAAAHQGCVASVAAAIDALLLLDSGPRCVDATAVQLAGSSGCSVRRGRDHTGDVGVKLSHWSGLCCRGPHCCWCLPTHHAATSLLDLCGRKSAT